MPGDDGAEALAAAAASSRSLRKLHLAGNGVTAAQMRVVARAVNDKEYRV
jgi:hypothetical protein